MNNSKINILFYNIITIIIIIQQVIYVFASLHAHTYMKSSRVAQK